MMSFLLSACSFIKWQAVNFPTTFFDGNTINNVVFDENNNLSLMITRADGENKAMKKALPVIVFYYGGRWSEGEKEKYRFVATSLAKKGFIVVVPDYRKYPAVKYPAFQEDAAKSLAWVYRHIEQYGGDPDRLFVAGHSSGAHIGAMLAANKTFLESEGVSPNIIKAFVGLAGPYHFSPEAEDMKNIFSDVQDNDYAAMKVSSYVGKDTPPMLLLYGLEDEIVHKRNIDMLKKAADKNGANVETILYEDMDHVDIISALSWYFNSRKPVLSDMVTFFDQYNQH